MKVYEAITAVAKAMSHEGISKGRSNAQQGYKFRGIDDVLNALSSALVSAGLVILPRVMSREVTERQTAKGGALFYVTVEVEFDLVAVEDGSKHTVKTYGEAMDSADKATNKAMSAAYKYLALLTFCIPTEASPDTDADFSTHDVAATKAVNKIKAEAKAPTADDMSPRARAMRIVAGVAKGDAAGAAEFLATLDQPALEAIWQHLDAPTADALTAAWPEVAA
jgi:ERF superfamily